MAGLQIILPTVFNNPDLPYIIKASALSTAAAGCLACWEMQNRGDNLHTDGTGKNLTGPVVFDQYGLVLAQGSNGVSTGYTPASPNITIAIAAQIDSGASADGFFWTNTHVASSAGAGLQFQNASPAVRGQAIQSSGSAISTTSAARSKGSWFACAMAIGATQIDMTMDSGSVVSTSSYSTLNNPTQPILLGDGYQSTLGVKGRIGCMAIYSGALGSSDRTAVIVAMRTLMATRGVTIP